MTQLPEGLPELPTSARVWQQSYRDSFVEVVTDETQLFTADQMRGYGLACYRAGMERAAVICEELNVAGTYGLRPKLAAAIRAEKPNEKIPRTPA